MTTPALYDELSDPFSDAFSDVLRSELVFLPPGGSVTRVDDCIVVLTPDNPTFWWGNTLVFDGPPRDGDFDRWRQLFDLCVRGPQPASRHTTFGWRGAEAGHGAPFVAAGFRAHENIVLAAEAGDPVVAPHPHEGARIEPIGGVAWTWLLDLLVDENDEGVSGSGYRAFAERRIAGWRRLVDAGLGTWLGVRDPEADRFLAALGVFVEAAPDDIGCRIGRFQHVVTRREARGVGLAGTLVAAASRVAFGRHGATRLLIVADEHDEARRVYTACGFSPAGHTRGLELGAY